jgi:hypothetical protein
MVLSAIFGGSKPLRVKLNKSFSASEILRHFVVEKRRNIWCVFHCLHTGDIVTDLHKCQVISEHIDHDIFM